MTEPENIVILGAGQAGLACAAALRRQGYRGALTIVGAENALPYQRPPLSKAILRGQTSPDSLALRSAAWFAEQHISLLSGLRATAIDRVAARLTLSDGRTVSWDRLVLATGAGARPLPPALGGDLAGVMTLRSLADAEKLRTALGCAQDLAIIGGGYIGLEIAAVARDLGKNVTLIERDERLLSRVAGPESAAWLQALHEAKGVRILTGVPGFTPVAEDGRIRALRLENGQEIPADLLVAGIGSLVDTDIAAAAGLRTGVAILCDAMGRTSDPRIWAAGDCAAFRQPDGSDLRLESVGHAIDSGELVARNLLGADEVYQPKPWFWSDQYDRKLQIAGLSRPGDHVVLRESVAEGRSHWYFRAERLVAVDALHAPLAFATGRRMLAEGISPDPRCLADPGLALRELLTARQPVMKAAH